MQENRIELELTSEEETQITGAIAVLETVLLPKLIVLEKTEKAELLRMGDKSVAFVNKGLEVAKQDTDLLKTFISVDAMDKDVKSIAQLRSLDYRLSRILSAIDDSFALVGHEAYSTSLMIYSLMKNAAKMGHPGAKEKVAELKQRFPRTRSKKGNDETVL